EDESPAADAHAALLDAAVARHLGDVPRARARYALALRTFERHEMALHGACALWRLAALDGDEASAHQARERLSALGARAPRRILALVAPGA
ncbi:MAG: hypothetical protein KC503_14160, partial [Myxococcales bacterium]|nr:hypothetical protein [Myxococcales bacterium]